MPLKTNLFRYKISGAGKLQSISFLKVSAKRVKTPKRRGKYTADTNCVSKEQLNLPGQFIQKHMVFFIKKRF